MNSIYCIIRTNNRRLPTGSELQALGFSVSAAVRRTPQPEVRIRSEAGGASPPADPKPGPNEK